MEKIHEEVGKRHWETREQHGYTRESLAEKIGITPKYLYEIEMGKRAFSVVILYHLSEALGVDCEYLVTGRKAFPWDRKVARILEKAGKEKANKIVKIMEDMCRL